MPQFTLIDRTCPICSNNAVSHLFADANIDQRRLDEFAFASRKLPEYMHWRLWECGKCDLLYANPAPAQSELATLYKDAAFDSSTEAHYASRTYGAVLRKKVITRLPDLTGALDIGTGD